MLVQRYVRKLEGGHTGGVANHCGSARQQPFNITNSQLSVCCHCHPADGTFNPRDALIHTISPNVLAETNKEVEKSEIASRYRASMARNHRLHHPFIVGVAPHAFAVTKFQTKINSGGLV